MRNVKKLSALIKALAWALDSGVAGYLDWQGRPTYMSIDQAGDWQEITPPEALKAVLDRCVRGGKHNGVETLSPAVPIDARREAEYDAHINHLEHANIMLMAQVDRLERVTDERNAYQTKLIRAAVIGNSSNAEDVDKRREFHTSTCDLLMHWADIKKKG